MENRFAKLVGENWLHAVMRAAHEIDDIRPDVLAALCSTDAEVRSVAVAALNESNDALAHDDIAAMLDDQNENVRDEVLEYLQEFSQPKDASRLYERIGKPGYDCFLVTRALARIVDFPDGLLNEDVDAERMDTTKAAWKRVLFDAELLR